MKQATSKPKLTPADVGFRFNDNGCKKTPNTSEKRKSTILPEKALLVVQQA